MKISSNKRKQPKLSQKKKNWKLRNSETQYFKLISSSLVVDFYTT